MVLDKDEIHRIVSSCNDFAEAEKRSKFTLQLKKPPYQLMNKNFTVIYFLVSNY